MLIKSAVEPILQNQKLCQKVTGFMTKLYSEVDDVCDTIQFSCKNCKNCCDFDASGLNLFASNLELAFFLINTKTIPTITANVCPFLSDSGCGVRDYRPLGCRTFFCMPPENYDQQNLYETNIAKIKAFIKTNNLPYNYSEWIKTLKEFSNE
jgi:Fe-S-cluster containining protein